MEEHNTNKMNDDDYRETVLRQLELIRQQLEIIAELPKPKMEIR